MSLKPSILVVTLFMFAVACLAAPQTVSTPPDSPSSVDAAADPNVPCGFQGDDNTYGLGIRIGVYLQWMTSAIGYTFLPEEGATMRGVNLCFVLSNLAGLLYITCVRGQGQPSGQLFAVECWIVLSFCLGGVCSGANTTFAAYRASSIGMVIQFLLTGAMLFYGIWFVYIGMDTMAAPLCSRFAFFFTKVDLFHWFRTLLKVLFTAAVPAYGIALMALCGYVLTSRDRIVQLLTSALPADPEAYPFSFSLSLTLVFFIISTELVIKWNHIENVQSVGGTGQILPIVVSAAGLLRVVYKLFVIPFYGDDDHGGGHQNPIAMDARGQ